MTMFIGAIFTMLFILEHSKTYSTTEADVDVLNLLVKPQLEKLH